MIATREILFFYRILFFPTDRPCFFSISPVKLLIKLVSPDWRKFTIHFFAMIEENPEIWSPETSHAIRIYFSLIHHGWGKFWNLGTCNPPGWQKFTRLYLTIGQENLFLFIWNRQKIFIPPKIVGNFFVPPPPKKWPCKFSSPPPQLSPLPNPYRAMRMTTS